MQIPRCVDWRLLPAPRRGQREASVLTSQALMLLNGGNVLRCAARYFSPSISVLPFLFL